MIVSPHRGVLGALYPVWRARELTASCWYTTKRPMPSRQTVHTIFHPCASFRTLSLTYAMMESRTRTEAEHQAGRTQSGLCNRPGSGDRPPAPAGPPDVSDPPVAVATR